MAADRYVDALRECLAGGTNLLGRIPGIVQTVIERDLWRVRPKDWQRRSTVTFNSWEEFCQAAPPPGLGEDPDKLKRLCADDLTVRDLLDRVCQRPSDIHVGVNNVNARPQGNSADRALRRLRKDRPDLHAKVLKGELSPHGAMVKAGLRPRLVSLPLEVNKLVAALKRHLSDSELRELKRLL